jgi:hypothetical protein
MTDVARIIDALEKSPAEGAQAMAAARLGFLEWVFGAPGAVTAGMARDALGTLAARDARSAAARAFVGCLREASLPLAARATRRGGMRAKRMRWIN